MYIHEDYGGFDPQATVVDRLAAYHELTSIIDRSIAMLDELDGDTDLESSLDYQALNDVLGLDDLERDDDEHFPDDDGDSAPSLGWNDAEASTCRYGAPITLYSADCEEDAGDQPESVDEDGGDVVDEPHDAANTFDEIVADQDAAHLLHDELSFDRLLDRTRRARLIAHDATRCQIASVTGHMPGSHWKALSRIGAGA